MGNGSVVFPLSSQGGHLSWEKWLQTPKFKFSVFSISFDHFKEKEMYLYCTSDLNRRVTLSTPVRIYLSQLHKLGPVLM